MWCLPVCISDSCDSTFLFTLKFRLYQLNILQYCCLCALCGVVIKCMVYFISGFLQDSLSSDSGSNLSEEPVISPRRLSMSRDKENFPSPYYSPSRNASLPHRTHSSPLQDVQNTVNRNLSYNSPHKKVGCLGYVPQNGIGVL